MFVDSKWVNRKYLGGTGSQQEWKKPNATYKRYDISLRYLTGTQVESQKERRGIGTKELSEEVMAKTFSNLVKNNPQIQEVHGF